MDKRNIGKPRADLPRYSIDLKTYKSISYHTKEYEEGRPLRKHMESIKLPKVNGAQATYAITQQKSSKTKHNPRMHPYAPAEQNHICTLLTRQVYTYIQKSTHIISKQRRTPGTNHTALDSVMPSVPQ